MMIMRWSNVQTNEYDIQDKTYPIIYTHHKLHNNNKKTPAFPRMYMHICILLCTLMLYICDRSTPDLNKDDELNWTELNK